MFMFFIGFGSWLGEKLSFHPIYEAGFYKPTILQLHPPLNRITAYATAPGYFSTILAFMLLIQNNGAGSMVSTAGPGFEPTTTWM